VSALIDFRPFVFIYCLKLNNLKKFIKLMHQCLKFQKGFLNSSSYNVKIPHSSNNVYQQIIRKFSFAFREYRDMDLYGVLKVEKTATQAQIKQAYYEMAKRYHPDTNNSATS